MSKVNRKLGAGLIAGLALGVQISTAAPYYPKSACPKHQLYSPLLKRCVPREQYYTPHYIELDVEHYLADK